MANTTSGQEQRSERTMRLLAVVMAAGLLGILLYAAQFWKAGQVPSVAGLGILMAGAAAVAGGLLGFLFAIPRAVTTRRAAATASADASEPEAPRYETNTNLEEISDWLTKILVGVGLTELRSLPDALDSLSVRLGPILGGSASSGAFAETILIYFAICGFLEGYLWTRVFLAGEFQLAALSLLGKRVQNLEEQTQRDGKAIALALSQLNPAPGAAPVKEKDLQEAIAGASTTIRAQIFYQAQALRSEEWNRDKKRMALTIPIFRALIANDTDGCYHRNHAQLGYALKDQLVPNWPEAERELNRAIEIRGPWQEHGWLWYEFNRAVCRIAQDPGYNSERPTEPRLRATILDDLRVAALELVEYLDREHEPKIARWLVLNGITVDQLMEEAHQLVAAGH